MSHLEITDIGLVHCNIVKKIINMIRESYACICFKETMWLIIRYFT